MANQEKTDKELDDEENNKTKVNPYLGLIELCDQLVNYCQVLLPSKGDAVPQKTQENKLNIEAVLKSDEWKKDKVTVMKGKGDGEDEFASLTNKKKKG